MNALPRLALVIGNAKYVEAPLKNPGNDAKGIAGELQKLGFQVNLKLDACRDHPFGNKVHSQAKGLSQFDARPGSLLAYHPASGAPSPTR